IEAAGGKALAIKMNVLEEDEVAAALAQAADHFGGIDILVNNASAISLTPTEMTKMKRYDLMHGINTRGTYMTSKLAIPYLKKSDSAHVLTLSPPLDMQAKWFAPHVAYTMSKFGMSMVTLGMAQEFADDNICFNALWPQTTVATAAVNNLLGGDELMKMSRTPEVVADAACEIFKTRETGNFFIDETVLRKAGVTDFEKYSVTPGVEPFKDLFVE
ncbi:MAG: SDR family oxidoreductase, partial [Saprospiraceae bacterium]